MTEIAAVPEILAGRFETTDLDEHADSMAAWQIRFDKLSRGPFQTRVDFIQTPAVTIYRQWWNGHLHAIGETPEGYAYLGGPVSRGSEMLWRGRDLDARHVAHGPPGLETDFTTLKRMDAVVMLVRPMLIERHLGSEAASALVGDTDHVTLGPRFRLALTGTVEHLIETIASAPDPLSDRAARDAFEFELLEMLAENLEVTAGRPESESRPGRSKALLRALEYVDELCEPVPVPKIAETVGVSLRTLEYAFLEKFGTPPSRYLRYSRINKLRRYLVDAEPGATSVTRAAAQFGFSELGRMASEYRSLFGETPSATLRRRRPRASMRPALGIRGGSG